MFLQLYGKACQSPNHAHRTARKIKNMKISVWDGGLSDSYLKQVTQLGADCIDFGGGNAFPGVDEQGYPDLDEVLKIKNGYALGVSTSTG